MNNEELTNLINKIEAEKSEDQYLEIKAARNGCPKHLYNTLSSFSNQSEGGTIVFGIDESQNFELCGVYDAQDLQKKVNAQGKEMEPIVSPIYTIQTIKGKTIVTAEISPVLFSNRPCYRKSAGINQGSYKRVGDEDLKMDAAEIFDYYVFRHSLHIDKEEIQDDREYLNEDRIAEFLKLAKYNKKNFESMFSDDEILNVLNVRSHNHLTKAGALIFSKYPQMYFPQLSIHAVAYPGNEVGELGRAGERFLDNENITGSIPDMLEQALAFVRKNIREKTIIIDGKRIDRFDYPINALREAILNALIHRDYSNLSERKPIRLEIFKNRIEIISPGGLYGDSDIKQLGQGSQGTRNENIVNILEILKVCENRYSGIPIMRKETQDYNLPEPVFINRNNVFKVIFFNEEEDLTNNSNESEKQRRKSKKSDEDVLEFCSTPRSRQELKDFFKTNSNNIFTKRILPLVRENKLKYLYPERPQSPNQKYIRDDTIN